MEFLNVAMVSEFQWNFSPVQGFNCLDFKNLIKVHCNIKEEDEWLSVCLYVDCGLDCLSYLMIYLTARWIKF